MNCGRSNGIYSFDFDISEDKEDTSFIDKKNIIKGKLSFLLKDTALSRDIITEVNQALASLQKITEIEYLTTFYSITIMKLLKKVEDYKKEKEKREAAFLEMYSRYKALCTMAGEDVKMLSYSEETEKAIEYEIERLELLLVKHQEQAYISNSIDEVMEEMGYSVLGSREVTKKNGKHFRNELYKYSEGTAVNITYSSDGKIVMELGGLDTSDRLPNDYEESVLCSDMEEFCDSFKEIEKRLAEKGVVLADRISLLPPEKEYAQIINTSDYQMRSETESISKRKKRRILTSSKHIKKE